eukprot:4312467-Amphidinium_carterae.1
MGVICTLPAKQAILALGTWVTWRRWLDREARGRKTVPGYEAPKAASESGVLLRRRHSSSTSRSTASVSKVVVLRLTSVVIVHAHKAQLAARAAPCSSSPAC